MPPRRARRSAPFDEAFPTAAGEDRAWCDRLRASGHRIEFDADAWVLHEPALDRARRSGASTRATAPARTATSAPDRRDRAGSRRGFYVRLFRRAFADGVATGVLVMMTQVATAVGLAGEAYRARAGR